MFPVHSKFSISVSSSDEEDDNGSDDGLGDEGVSDDGDDNGD